MATRTSQRTRRASRPAGKRKAGGAAKRARRPAKPARSVRKPTRTSSRKPATQRSARVRARGKTPAARKTATPKRAPAKAAAKTKKPAAAARRAGAAAKPRMRGSAAKLTRRTAAPRAASRRTVREHPRATTTPPSPPAPPPFELTETSAQFPCGDAAVRAATGHGWQDWLRLVEASGLALAVERPVHAEIRALVQRLVPTLDDWWAQMVAVGYERARGLRAMHQSSRGEFQATAAKTFAAPAFAAFAAWADDALRRRWLDAPGLEVTKVNPGRNIRARWPDGALLDIRFADKGPVRCQVVVDTVKLTDAEAVAAAKTFWQSQFARLAAFLGA